MNVGREGSGNGVTIGETVVGLKNKMDTLDSAVSAVNTSLLLHVNESVVYKKKLEVTILNVVVLIFQYLFVNIAHSNKTSNDLAVMILTRQFSTKPTCVVAEYGRLIRIL